MVPPKIDNPASSRASLTKRRAGLFKKANELSILCDAELAMIIVSPDGKLHEFASSTSSVEQIVAKTKMCMERGKEKALQPNPEEAGEEVPEEAGVPEEKADELKLRNILGKDLAEMSLEELTVLEEKLKEGVTSIKDTQMKLLQSELAKSKSEKEKVLKQNEILLSQVEELSASVARPIYYPVPIFSINNAAMECDFPSTSYAAQLAITNGPGAEGNLQNADKASLPSTSFGAPLATDNGYQMQLMNHRAKFA